MTLASCTTTPTLDPNDSLPSLFPTSATELRWEMDEVTANLRDRLARREAASAYLGTDPGYLKEVEGLQAYYDPTLSTNEDEEMADYDGDRNEDKASDLADANVIGSGVESSWSAEKGRFEKHRLLLDLDVPARLIPSSTEGHSHLYVDIEIDADEWADLIEALAKADVIERGYADISLERGHTDLRLPWIKKGGLQ